MDVKNSKKIYKGFKEVTPKSLFCAYGACPAIYASEQDNENYLLIGKIIPKDSLEEVGLGNIKTKIGKNEVLIEVHKDLIDKHN